MLQLHVTELQLHEQHETDHRQSQQTHLELIRTHQGPRRPHKKQQNMQLPTEERMPAQWTLPPIVCHQPSHLHPERQ